MPIDNYVPKNAFEGQRWVKRLVSAPEFVWNNHISVIMKAFTLRVPNKDYDVYSNIEIVDFINGATPGFRTALIGNLLEAVGIELSSRRDNEGKISPFIEINPEKSMSAYETIGSIMRKRENDIRVKNYIGEKTQYLESGTEIDDVASRNRE